MIISENHVLTSSNCLGPSFVRVGSDKKNQGGRVNGIINFTSHDTYDLMLIQLKQPIKFNDKVRSIRLLDAELPENSVGWIVGYGQGDQLQKSMIPIVDKKVCEKIYEEQWGIKLRPRTICGGYHGRGGISPCSGDLGGPLMVNERLAGVISRATSCDDPYTLGFYTEIAQFRRWIEEYTKVSFWNQSGRLKSFLPWFSFKRHSIGNTWCLPYRQKSYSYIIIWLKK